MSLKWRWSVSLILGGVVMFGFWLALEKTKKEVQKQVTTQPVARAKKYIKTGRTLKPQMIEWISIPEAYLEPTALLTKEEIFDSQGRSRYKVRTGLLKGEQITHSKLVDRTLPLGLSWILDEKKSALTLHLKSEQAVGGWIEPGDWIQIYGTFHQQTDWPKAQSQSLFGPVRILAVNQRLWDPLAPLSTKKNHQGMEMEDYLVTIEVSAKQAALVNLAQKKGSIQLALLSPLADRNEKRMVVDLKTLNP